MFFLLDMSTDQYSLAESAWIIIIFVLYPTVFQVFYLRHRNFIRAYGLSVASRIDVEVPNIFHITSAVGNKEVCGDIATTRLKCAESHGDDVKVSAINQTAALPRSMEPSSTNNFIIDVTTLDHANLSE
jgi:hypothetical protein